MKNSYSLKQCLLLALLALVCQISLSAQGIEAYPTNWFVQMNNKEVQVLLRSTTEDFKNAQLELNYPGVAIKKYIILAMGII
jgi:hypothetical protein